MSHRKIRDLIDRIKKSKQLKFIVIGILILALILTVYLAQKQQEIRQHANTNQATITVNPLTAKPEESVMVSWTLASASTTVIPSPNASPASLLAFVFTGESNAGGYGLNDAATADELAPTSAVKILNNTTLQFEDLDVGTNNTIDHWNGPTSTFHGFELGLANSVKVHAFPNNPHVYLIKTGQGNSFISQWNSDHTFWQKFVQRTSAAKTQLPTNTPTQWVVWISLGINDNNIGTSPTTFKTDMLGYINKIKADLPGAIIIMTQFQAMGSPRNGYDTVMQELADSEQNVSVVDTSGSSNDGSHWTYAGNKELATKMVTITKNSLDRLYPTATISPTMTQNTFTGAETLQLYALPPASESAQIQSAGPKMYLHCQYPDLPEVGAHPAPPSAPIFTGQCAYHIPSDVNPGSYIIRMLAADGTTILGESGPFTVDPIMQKHPTSFSLFLSLSGIGSSSGELTPQHPLRPAIITIFDAQNKLIATHFGKLTYTESQKNFQGLFAISLPQIATESANATSSAREDVQSGTYILKIQTPQFLREQLQGIVNIKPGTTVDLPSMTLLTGDINTDNKIDILDYNLIVSCFGEKINSPACKETPQFNDGTAPISPLSPLADLNDNGVVDGVDYNLFIKTLSTKDGD